MAEPVVATDSQAEAASRRIARRLGSDDLRRLAEHCCCLEGAPAEVTERCLCLRIRARAALHKSGLIG